MLLSAAMVADLRPGPRGALDNAEFATVDGVLYFSARTSDAGATLWRTDGTSGGTVEISRALRDPRHLTAFEGSIYFAARDPVYGLELFKTDPGGTTRLTDLWDGDTNDPESLPGIADIWVLGRKLFFSTTRFRDVRLWTTDGTRSGTVELSSLGQGAPLALNGKVLFGNGANQLTVTDGSLSGTKVIGSYSSPEGPDPVLFLTRAGDRACYVQGVDGRESWLWSTDGTAAGTIRLQRGLTGNVWYDFGPLAPLGNELIYLSTEDGGPRNLWKTDGTPAGTKLLRNFGDGWVSSIDLSAAGNRLYFSAYDTHGQELWATDGTSAGTRMVRDITPGPAGTDLGPYRTDWRDALYFIVAGPGDMTQTIWRSDGSESGTVPVYAFSGLGLVETPGFFSGTQDRLFLWADDGIHGTELWSTDGTPAGTRLLHDVRPGAESSNPNSLVISNDTIFFAADDGVHGMELWNVTDDAPFASLSSGVLTVRGTEAADTIIVSPRATMIDATLNGRTLSFPAASVRRVQIDSTGDNDRIDCAAIALPLTVRAGSGNDSVIGGRGSDVLIGEAGRDTLLGGRGDDTLDGQSGHDYLVGGEGNDLLSGGSGDDRIEGNAGRDTLYGRAGNDALFGGSGNDRLDGGDGNDHLMGQAGLDRSYGGAGDDKFLARDLLADILDGGSGFDRAQIDPALDRAGSIERLLS